ncbi:hypothetical protein JCM11641_003149 [Rhodosporidiobolus odoratus]
MPTLARNPSSTPSEPLSSSSRTFSHLPPPPPPLPQPLATTGPRLARRPTPRAPINAAAMPPPPPRLPSLGASGPAGSSSESGNGGPGFAQFGSSAATNSFSSVAGPSSGLSTFARASPPTGPAPRPHPPPFRPSPSFGNRDQSPAYSSFSRTPRSPAASTSAAGPSYRLSSHPAGTDRAGSGPTIDLTTSSPDLSSSSRTLVNAARASGLSFPGGPAVGAGRSFSPAIGPSRNTRSAAAAVEARRRDRDPTGQSLVLSDDDDEEEIEYAPRPRVRPSGARAGAGAGARRAMGGNGGSGDGSDSDIEIVSERPAAGVPLPPPRTGTPSDPYLAYTLRRHIGSPPPFVVPSGSTSTSTSTSSANPRRSNRCPPPSYRSHSRSRTDSDSDVATARQLAAIYAAEDRAATAEMGMGSRRGFGGVFSRSASGSGAGGAGAGNGVGGGGGGGRGLVSDFATLAGLDPANLPGMGMYSTLLGGGFWNGGLFGIGGSGGAAGGGAFAYGYPGGAAAGVHGGWGGAAKVKAAGKKYGVKMSHPVPVQRGFARDIKDPEEVDEGPVKKKAKKGKGKAKVEEVEEEQQVPVCASCLEPLYLGGEGDRKVFALKCGHVVCKGCLEEARGRVKAERGAVTHTGAGGPKGKKTLRAKGKKSGQKGKAPDEADHDFTPLHVGSHPSTRDEMELDAIDGGPSSSALDLSSDERPLFTSLSARRASKAKTKDKGKAKSRADETGVEELWTICPVVACDGKGGDVLVEGGYQGPYELFVTVFFVANLRRFNSAISSAYPAFRSTTALPDPPS